MASCQDQKSAGETAVRGKGQLRKQQRKTRRGPGEHAAHIPPASSIRTTVSGAVAIRANSASSLPSMREIKRIPVFQPDAMSGWGLTNESRKILGTKPDGSLMYTTGDSHHVLASYTDGTYDGKYAWINDKLNSRMARVRLDYFVCDKITELPNVQGFHGASRTSATRWTRTSTTRRGCSSAPSSASRCPTTGAISRRPENYRQPGHLRRCRDAWKCAGNAGSTATCDLLATSYDGKLAASNQYNRENGVQFSEMMSAERDNVRVLQHRAHRGRRSRPGKFKTVGDSKVPVVDGTQEANKDPKTAADRLCLRAEEPARRERQPDGKYFICAGKLSPTCTVIELSLVLKWFDGELKEARRTIVAELEVGLGPLHTTFDGKGNAYTTLFLDSQVVKWNIEAAIKAFKGDKNAKVVVDRIDVQYQPGPPERQHGRNHEADGSWLAVGSKFSKDRFLPAGPLHPENEQLIDISGEKMVLLADHPVRGEPHDFIIFKRELIKPKQVYALDDFADRGEGLQGKRRRAQRPQGHGQADLAGARLQPARVQGEEGRRGHAGPDQPGQDRGPDARLRHPELQRQLHRQPAGDEVGDLHGGQARRVLGLLHPLLPRAAPGDAQPDDRRGLTAHLKPRASRAGLQPWTP